MRTIDDITRGIIGDAIAVHRELGPGLLESTYEGCLGILLAKRGWRVDRQLTLPAAFRGEPLECAYRVDLLVEDQVVVELKTVAALNSVHFAQLMTYLKFSGCQVGLLINFNVTRLTDGLRRVVRNYHPPVLQSTPTPSASLGD